MLSDVHRPLAVSLRAGGSVVSTRVNWLEWKAPEFAFHLLFASESLGVGGGLQGQDDLKSIEYLLCTRDRAWQFPF